MRRARAQNPALEAALAAAFERYLQEKNGNVKAAADTLGVDEQSMYKYMKGKVFPGTDVLLRAVASGLRLEYGGRQLVLDGTREVRKRPPEQLRLTFDPPLVAIDNPGQEVRVARVTRKPVSIQIGIALEDSG